VKRFVVGLVVGVVLSGGTVYAGLGWYTAKVKLSKDHRAGDQVKCDTFFSSFKTVECDEPK
jgi:hypothetical protein